MTRETVFKRMPFLLMAACVAVLAGCDEKKDEPRQEQPAEVAQESGEECLQRAIDKLALGEVDVAEEAAKKALELMPDSAEALLVDGQVAYRKGDLARAAKVFSAVASEKSLPAALRAEALVSRAVTEIRQGGFDAAP